MNQIANGQQNSGNIQQFSIVDYTIFIALLGLSSIIGIYYGFMARNKQNNADEYLLGSKTMTLFPIAVSLIVSHISGITMLVFPTEVYAYGTQFWITFLSALAIVPATMYIFYPVFYDLKLISTLMYFEKRFHRSVRLVAAVVFLFGMVMFLPVIIYIPGLAFNQVSGVNVHIVTSIMCIVCVFYTSIGGLRAVVWTDMLQFFLMLGAILAVIILGICNLNDPLDIWNVADRGERLTFFNFDPNPLIRSSFWTYSIGITTLWASIFSSSQSVIQKLLALPDPQTAKKAIWIFVIGKIAFHFCAILTGLVMYAYLVNCDPFTDGSVKKLDQVLPYYVMKLGSAIPGLPGLFIAGIFSGALSTMSGMLNTSSCIVYEDFLYKRLKNYSDRTRSMVLKLIVLVLGMVITALVFQVEKAGQIFQIATTISGIPSGTLLGLFTTGMLCRRINAKGAISGAIVSILVVGFIVLGALKLPKPPMLPMRTDDCGSYGNETSHIPFEMHHTKSITSSGDEIFWLFRISFMYYAFIGCAMVWIVSLPISLLTSSEELTDENVLAPFMRQKKVTNANEMVAKVTATT